MWPETLSSQAVGWLAVLLDATVKGTVILILAGCLTLIFRRTSAATRHMIWLLAVVALVALPVLSATLTAWRIPILPEWMTHVAKPEAEPSVAEKDKAVESSPAVEVPAHPPLPPIALQSGPSSVLPPSPAVGSPEAPAVSVPKPIESAPKPPRWPVWVLAVWGAGLVMVIARLLMGTVGVWRLAHGARCIRGGSWEALVRDISGQLGLERPVVLLQSRHAAMPLTWGIVRPVALLPTDADSWSEDRKRIVLLHELAHVKRWDTLTQMVAQMACALYWFNPLVWLANRQVRIERERACDDLVLGSGFKPTDYGEHLLDIVRSLRSPLCTSLTSVSIARKSHFEGRLLAILDSKRNRRALTRLAVIVGLLILTCVLLPLGTMRLAARAEGQAADKKDVAEAVDGIEARVKGVLPKGWSVKTDGSMVTVERDEEVRGVHHSPVGMMMMGDQAWTATIKVGVGPRISKLEYCRMASQNEAVVNEARVRRPNYDPVEAPIRGPHVLPTDWDGGSSLWISDWIPRSGSFEFTSEEVGQECRGVYEAIKGLFQAYTEPHDLWGTAVNSLQAGVDFEGLTAGEKPKAKLLLRMRNDGDKPIRILRLSSRVLFWGEALPLEIRAERKTMPYGGPVLTPPPPPGPNEYITLAPNEIDAVEVEMNPAHWGVDGKSQFGVGFVLKNTLEKVDPGPGWPVVAGLWTGRAMSGVITVDFGAKASEEPKGAGVDLDAMAKVLAEKVGGKWEKRERAGTGPELWGVIEGTEGRVTRFLVFPFPYDEAGKDKVDGALKDMSWSLRTLGFSDSCTVAVYGSKTSALSQEVIKALKLTVVRPSPQAVAGASRLKEDFIDLQLSVICEGVKNEFLPRLFLACTSQEKKSGGEIAQDGKGKTVPISRSEAARIFEHLGNAGYIDRIWDQWAGDEPKTSADGAGYVLDLRGKTKNGGEFKYRLKLGWGLGLLKDAEDLRKALDGDAGKGMDALLEELRRVVPKEGTAAPGDEGVKGKGETVDLEKAAKLLSKEVEGAGWGEAEIERLTGMLEVGDKGQRIEAARRLDWLGKQAKDKGNPVSAQTEDKILEALMKAVETSGEWGPMNIIRSVAVHAEGASPEGVKKLVAWLEDLARTNRKELRYSAVEVLGQLGPKAKETVPVLAGLLSPEATNRAQSTEILNALKKMGKEASGAEGAVREFIEKVKDEPQSDDGFHYAGLKAANVRLSAYALLDGMGAIRAQDAKGIAQAMAGAEYGQAVREGARILVKMKELPPEIAPDLVAALGVGWFGGGHEEYGWSEDLKKLVVRMGEGAVEPLCEFIRKRNTPDWLFTTGDAVEVLSALGPKAKGALPLLIQLLRQEGPRRGWMTGGVSSSASLAASAIVAIGPEAVGPVSELLKEKDDRLRALAVLILGQVDSEEAMSRVRASLTDQDDGVRAAGHAAMIGRKVDVSLHVRALGELLQSRNETTREIALSTLRGATLEKAELVAVAKEALANKDAAVRRAGVRLLERWVKDDEESALLIRAHVLEDADAEVRWLATEYLVLARLQPEEVKATLVKVLKDSSPTVRNTAARGLDNFRKDGKELRQPLTEALKDSDDRVSREAREALKNLQVYNDNFEALMWDAGHGPNWDDRTRAWHALVPFGERAKGAVPFLVKGLSSDETREVRSAAEVLAQLGVKTNEALEGLRRAAGKPESDVRIEVMNALEKLQDKEAASVVITNLSDNYAPVRNVAAQWLGSMRIEEAVGALTRRLADPDETVRREAAIALGRIGEPAGTGREQLEALEKDQSPLMHLAVLYALVSTGWDTPEGSRILQLADGLKSDNAAVRLYTVGLLDELSGHVNAPLVIPVLEKASQDEDPEVRSQADRLLRKLHDKEAPMVEPPKAPDVNEPVRPEPPGAGAAEPGAEGRGVLPDAGLHLVQRENGPTDVAEIELLEIGTDQARRIHFDDVGGQGLVGGAVVNGGLNHQDLAPRGLNADRAEDLRIEVLDATTADDDLDAA